MAKRREVSRRVEPAANSGSPAIGVFARPTNAMGDTHGRSFIGQDMGHKNSTPETLAMLSKTFRNLQSMQQERLDEQMEQEGLEGYQAGLTGQEQIDGKMKAYYDEFERGLGARQQQEFSRGINQLFTTGKWEGYSWNKAEEEWNNVLDKVVQSEIGDINQNSSNYLKGFIPGLKQTIENTINADLRRKSHQHQESIFSNTRAMIDTAISQSGKDYTKYEQLRLEARQSAKAQGLTDSVIKDIEWERIQSYVIASKDTSILDFVYQNRADGTPGLHQHGKVAKEAAELATKIRMDKRREMQIERQEEKLQQEDKWQELAAEYLRLEGKPEAQKALYETIIKSPNSGAEYGSYLLSFKSLYESSSRQNNDDIMAKIAERVYVHKDISKEEIFAVEGLTPETKIRFASKLDRDSSTGETKERFDPVASALADYGDAVGLTYGDRNTHELSGEFGVLKHKGHSRQAYAMGMHLIDTITKTEEYQALSPTEKYNRLRKELHEFLMKKYDNDKMAESQMDNRNFIQPNITMSEFSEAPQKEQDVFIAKVQKKPSLINKIEDEGVRSIVKAKISEAVTKKSIATNETTLRKVSQENLKLYNDPDKVIYTFKDGVITGIPRSSSGVIKKHERVLHDNLKDSYKAVLSGDLPLYLERKLFPKKSIWDKFGRPQAHTAPERVFFQSEERKDIFIALEEMVQEGSWKKEENIKWVYPGQMDKYFYKYTSVDDSFKPIFIEVSHMVHKQQQEQKRAEEEKKTQEEFNKWKGNK